MAKSKSKRKRKKRKGGKQRTAPPLQKTPKALPFDDDPLFTAVLFSPLIVGSIAASGLQPPNMLQFTLILLPLILAHYLGMVWGSKKDSAAKPDEERLDLYTKVVGFFVMAVMLAGGFYYVTQSALAAGLLVACACSVFLFKLTAVSSLPRLLWQGVFLLIVPSLLALLGVFAQAEKVIPQTFVLGFVTGSLLVAANIAKHASKLEKLGWKRSRPVPSDDDQAKLTFFTKLLIRRRKKNSSKEDNSEVLLPGIPSQLYATFLMAVPCLTLMLCILHVFPAPLMLGLIAQLPAARLATWFLKREATDDGLFRATTKLAAFNSVLMLIGGYFSSN